MTLWTRYSQRLLGAVGVAEPSQEQARVITERFADYAPHSELNSGAVATLAALQAADYTLALVSNRLTPLDEVVADLELEEYFAFTLAAGEIDIWKPDPGILLEAMVRGNCEPATSIYVGDNYYADVVCAQDAGLTPVLLDPNGIFPDADCRVIKSLTDLLDWLL
jgi:putative hydrolase of the HAD superfamily